MDYADCKKMAKLALLSRGQKLTDENIGTVIYFILKANHKYNENIGNIFGFRKLYIDYAMKTISTSKKRQYQKNIFYVPDYQNYSENASYQDFNSKLFWEDIEKKLTKREYTVIFSRIQENKTLREISNDINVSIETVRNILKSSYRKLKNDKDYKKVSG